MKRKLGIFTLIVTLCLSFGPRPTLAEPMDLNPVLAGPISGTETRITSSPENQYDPSISGNLIVYTHNSGLDSDIFYYNLSTGLEKQVTSEPGDQELADVSNGIITYTNLNNYDIMLYNTSDGQVQDLTAGTYSISVNPSLSGSIIAYEDKRTTPSYLGIWATNLSTGEERQVSNEFDLTVEARPSVSDGIIAWERCYRGKCDISTYNWETNQTTRLTDDPNRDLRRADTNGKSVVYDGLNFIDSDRDIYLYNLETGVETHLELPNEQVNANISKDGNYVTFESLTPEGVYHLKLWHIPSGKVFDVPVPGGGQFLNDIDGNHIVYTDDRNGQLDIYMYTFNPVEKNQAPDITITSYPNGPVAVNTPVTVSSNFTDPDTGDTHTATWDWGDGSQSSGIVNASGSVSGEHTFTTPGIYTLKVNITDKGGLSDIDEYRYLVVYNPEGGFVTGGGTIDSPEGAFISNPPLVGKANFGFVAKYQKGAAIPTGQTEFQFKLASLDFHSTSYDYLVVAGTKAQFKGAGTINGVGQYGFMITAIDSQDGDRFRIKIWDKSSDSVIYDTMQGTDQSIDPTSLISGSIVIHS